MHPCLSGTTLWWVTLIFMLFVLSKGNKVLANSLTVGNMTCVSRLFDSHILTRYFPFWFFNLSEYLRVQFSSRLLDCYTCIHVSTWADLFLSFQIDFSSFFVEILSFGFCLVNSECGAYLAVDHNLVYSYSTMF